MIQKAWNINALSGIHKMAKASRSYGMLFTLILDKSNSLPLQQDASAVASAPSSVSLILFNLSDRITWHALT